MKSVERFLYIFSGFLKKKPNPKLLMAQDGVGDELSSYGWKERQVQCVLMWVQHYVGSGYSPSGMHGPEHLLPPLGPCSTVHYSLFAQVSSKTGSLGNFSRHHLSSFKASV